ncbi:MAG: hypothetical protein JNM10_05360 [Planctomycetia bacterium]|nr:hypothetical protein [Planctomycetia bacterium]
MNSKSDPTERIPQGRRPSGTRVERANASLREAIEEVTRRRAGTPPIALAIAVLAVEPRIRQAPVVPRPPHLLPLANFANGHRYMPSIGLVVRREYIPRGCQFGPDLIPRAAEELRDGILRIRSELSDYGPRTAPLDLRHGDVLGDWEAEMLCCVEPDEVHVLRNGVWTIAASFPRTLDPFWAIYTDAAAAWIQFARLKLERQQRASATPSRSEFGLLAPFMRLVLKRTGQSLGLRGRHVGRGGVERVAAYVEHRSGKFTYKELELALGLRGIRTLVRRALTRHPHLIAEYRDQGGGPRFGRPGQA